MTSKVTDSLGDFVSLQRGTTYKGSLVGQPGPVLLGLASIEPNGGFRYGGFKTYGGDCPEKITLKPGDMYVSLKDVTQSGDLLGSVSRVPPDIPSGRLTQDTVRLAFDRRPISREYLYWLLRTPSYREYCRGCATGTTTLGLAREDFLSFPVPSPSSTDTLLVELLEGIEKRITLLRETNATLESIAQALFKSWFVDFDPVHAKMEGRAPEGMDEATAGLFPDMFEESALGLMPKGWRVVRLDSFIELAYGKALKAENRRAGPIPVYGSGGITGWHDQALVEQASIVVGRKGTVGSLYWESRPFFPIDTVFYVKSGKPLTYCYLLLKTLGLDSMNTDAAVPGLNRENVYRLLVTEPPGSVLAAFDSIASVLRISVDENEQQAQTLATLRDTLLPCLISDRLHLPEVEAFIDEVAA